MRYRILSTLVVFSLLGACGPLKSNKSKKKSAPVQSAPSQPRKSGGPFIKISIGNSRSQSEVCATKDDTSLAPDRVIQRKTITVKMEKQHVIRKDCTGKVTSDGMEKVTQPTEEIELTPVKSWAGQSSAMPYNRSTCTGVGAELEGTLLKMIFGIGLITDAKDGIKNKLGFPRVRFTVDTSPTFSHMHVRKNADNYIDYEFQKCLQKNSVDNTCEKLESVEKGTLILTVVYSENLEIGGVTEIQEKECKPAKL